MGIVVAPNEGAQYESMGDLMRMVLTGADTQEQYTLIEDSVKAGMNATLHLHREHSETFYIIDGTVRFTLGDRQVEASAGTTVYVPPNLPHAAQADAAGKMLTLFSPAGLEHVFAAFAQLPPEEASRPETFTAIARRFDIIDLATAPVPTLLHFYTHLLRGEAGPLLQLFAGEPQIDTPLEGVVQGADALRAFVAAQQAWLGERAAVARFVDVLVDEQRIVVEWVLELNQGGTAIALPVALAADRRDGAVAALRLYHSTWPLNQAHRVRAPVLSPATGLDEPPLIIRYMDCLASGDQEGILALFADDGLLREPSGATFQHAGPAQRRAFYDMIMSQGGVRLHHCSATRDGQRFAVEYICDRWGQTDLPPQAGLAVYVWDGHEQLRAARIYDDIDPPLNL